MKKPILITCLLLLAAPALAEDTNWVHPVIPSEEQKINALKLAYRLNGNSMVRDLSHGSLDLTGVDLRGIDVNSLDISSVQKVPPRVVRTIPIWPGTR